MGGDGAPKIVLKGASRARERFPNARFLVFGDEAEIGPVLERLPRLKDAVSLVHTTNHIAGDAKPSAALRTGRGSSMWQAIEAVHTGVADGVVSAGNTGALMAIAKFTLKMPAGISRPAMAGSMPTLKNECVMLDLGANIDCDAQNLVQFAFMGALFAGAVLGLPRPRVGLLNVGAEELKGHDVVRGAHAALRALEGAPFEYAGFIEGNDIAAGVVDVVVTDGFTGNVALKTIEGTSRLYSDFLRNAFRSSWLSRLGYLLARPALDKLRARVDPRRYNGAVFLGLNGVVVKAHGGSDALAFASAIGVALDMVQHGFMEHVREEFDRLAHGAMVVDPKSATS